LPPPPLSLLQVPSGTSSSASRIRGFPHVDGNFALHVYIEVSIPVASRKELGSLLKRVAAQVPVLHTVDTDLPVMNLAEDDRKFEQLALGRAFHVSLGRTVPIRMHQRDSIVAMLRHRLQSSKRYRMEFDKVEVFDNDDFTRTFLCLEVTTVGSREIKKQIDRVNEVYRLHNLPEFYEDPRPHISIAWGPGDVSDALRRAIGEETTTRAKTFCCCGFGRVSCKIGQKTFEICR
ncbi:hypothetical protein M569_10409, partial [Genlisea aurea]